VSRTCCPSRTSRPTAPSPATRWLAAAPARPGRGPFTTTQRRREDRTMPVYMYDPPERFVAGSVGQPGERIFYLQAMSQGRVTSVSLENFQVSLLAERLDELLDEVLRRSGGSPEVPAAAPAGLQDDGPLGMPGLGGFRVGGVALARGSPAKRG